MKYHSLSNFLAWVNIQYTYYISYLNPIPAKRTFQQHSVLLKFNFNYLIKYLKFQTSE